MSQHLRVAIHEWNKKTADELAVLITHHYYAEVECVDSSAGDLKSVEEMRKFKPHVFIVSQIANPLLNYSASGGLSFIECERHIGICRNVLSSFQTRPYLVSVYTIDGVREELFRRFRGRCLEWGFDTVCRRAQVNSREVGEWFKRARELYGEKK